MNGMKTSIRRVNAFLRRSTCSTQHHLVVHDTAQVFASFSLNQSDDTIFSAPFLDSERAVELDVLPNPMVTVPVEFNGYSLGRLLFPAVVPRDEGLRIWKLVPVNSVSAVFRAQPRPSATRITIRRGEII
jgi:hypothetical protein